MKLRKNEEAVSPVIGVILMVAITVILAAVIAAFVFGLGTPTQAPQASISITTASSTTYNITIAHRGGDSIDLNRVKAIIEQGTNRNIISPLQSVSRTFTVGDSLILNSNTSSVWHNNVALSPTPSGTNFTFSSGSKVTLTLIDTDTQKEISRFSVTAS